MNCLNLYAGIGGNRKLWTDCKVTAVEINPDIAAVYKELYPKDEVIVGDAHDYLLKHFHKFDFIWSSPPCQSHTRLLVPLMKDKKYRRFPDMSLYQEIVFLNQFCEKLWTVENVIPYYEPLIKPTQSFHRHLFWSNFGFSVTKLPCRKGEFIRMELKDLEEWVGVSLVEKQFSSDKEKNRIIRRQILRNCVHPLMGQQIFETAKRVWERRQSNKEKGILAPKPRGFGL